jgi:2-carboxy-1,4-naphthoquinone phytyltransferase
MQSSELSQPSISNRLWFAAIKPPMYSVAIMPIMVGTAIAYAETEIIHWQIFASFTIAAILILAWENLSNDVFDSETGIDLHKYHSVVNLTRNKNLVEAIANLCLVIGISAVGWIAWQQQDWTVIEIVLICCGLGYIYQAPPFRLGYQGWGEFLCFFAFGPLAVSAAYYSQTQTFSLVALAASAIVGIVTSLILFCSHFNQVTDDRLAGKRSPVVQLGSKRAAGLLPWICGAVYLLTFLGILLGFFPLATGLAGLGLPFAVKLCTWIVANCDREDLLKNCRFIAVGLHFATCLGLTLGFLV